jgi:transposase
METLTMSRKEVPRAGLLKAALGGRITNLQGATALGLSPRQFQRLKVRGRTEGARGLIHRGRGQVSPRRRPAAVQERIGGLLQTTYADFNDCHFTEKLHETEETRLHVSRATVRRIRRDLGLPPKRRRRRAQGRQRRIPEAAMGAMIQVDASPHVWLEARGPALTLVGAIDDATGAICALTFRPTEDLHGYAEVFRQVFTTHGLPLSVYGDRINILVRNDRHWSLEEELHGAQDPTHLGRVLRDLGIGYIAAQSPQAKGRVERLWQTLQDRLVSELRLHAIATAEAANAFLPDFITAFNRRFARRPAEPNAVWRRPPADLDLILSCRYQRTVGHDNTVRLVDRRIQIPATRGRSYAGCRVELRELLSGELVVLYHDALLATQRWPGPFTLKPRRAPTADRLPLRGRARRELRQALAELARVRVSSPTAPPTRPPSTPSALSPHSAQRRAPDVPAPTHPWRRPFSRRRLALEATQRG